MKKPILLRIEEADLLELEEYRKDFDLDNVQQLIRIVLKNYIKVKGKMVYHATA